MRAVAERAEELKAEALAIYNAEDRIPGVSFTHYGMVNFWQDVDVDYRNDARIYLPQDEMAHPLDDAQPGMEPVTAPS